jgi:hypothetical protein
LGQFFDVMGMYLVSGLMLVSAVSRWRNMSDRGSVLLYLNVVGALLVVLYWVPEVRRSLFAVVLLAAIAVELSFAQPRRLDVRVSYYLMGIVVSVAAFTIWNLDQNGIICSPQSVFQGHAV